MDRLWNILTMDRPSVYMLEIPPTAASSGERLNKIKIEESMGQHAFMVLYPSFTLFWQSCHGSPLMNINRSIVTVLFF